MRRWASLGVVSLFLSMASCLPERAPSATCPSTQSTTRLLLTTTDFSTGWARVFDPADCTLGPELLASTDVVPVALDDRAFLVHRFGTDRLDELSVDSAELEATSSSKIEVDGLGSANAQWVALDDDGRRYVSMYNAAEIQVFEGESQSPTARLDISALALDDPDGIPEISWVAWHADTLAVVVRTLDQGDGLSTVAPDRLELLAPETGESLDSIALEGEWTRQLRRDPSDPSVLYALSNALLRIDLGSGSTQAVIPSSVFADLGLDDPLLPQSFAVDWDTGAVFLAAYDAGFTGVTIYRGSLDGGPLVPVVDGLESVERTLEVIDGVVWFGDRRVGQEGMHAFGADGTDLSEGAFPTGLPPYSLTALP